MQCLREIDKDRYLLSFFVEPFSRQGLHALDMFNYEIARLREVAVQPHIGMIRLQWWRERVGEIYGGKVSTTHENLPEFARVLGEFGVDRGDVMALIDAREHDFVLEPPLSFEQFFDYARATHAPLLRIKGKIVRAQEEDAVVNRLAASYAALGLVRAAPFHHQQGRVYLPKLFSTSVVPHNAAMVESVRDVCRKVEQDMHGMVVTTPYLKAHAAFVRLYLKHIARCGYDPFHLTPLPFLELRLWWAVRF